MAGLSDHAAAVLEALRGCAADEAIALLVPHGLAAADRAAALDDLTGVVGELRAHGHRVKVTSHRKPDGELFEVELLEAA
jgi:hypothetical protein